MSDFSTFVSFVDSCLDSDCKQKVKKITLGLWTGISRANIWIVINYWLKWLMTSWKKWLHIMSTLLRYDEDITMYCITDHLQYIIHWTYCHVATISARSVYFQRKWIHSDAYSKEQGYKIFTSTCNVLCSSSPCVYYTSCIIEGPVPHLEVRMWLFLVLQRYFWAYFQQERTNLHHRASNHVFTKQETFECIIIFLCIQRNVFFLFVFCLPCIQT